MDYSISEVAEMTGLSTRTLRYYDEINLFTARRGTENGYRIYQSEDLDVLQVIMFLRKMKMPLEQIKAIILNEENDFNQLLKVQKERLMEKQAEITALIHLIDTTLANKQEGKVMLDKEKFEAFKQEKINENRNQFGEEVIEKYGHEALEKSEQNWQHLSQIEYQCAEECELAIKRGLQELLKRNHESMDKDIAKEVFKAHAEWLKLMSGQYSEGYHLAMADLYVDDIRFTAYYDNLVGEAGAAALLSRIIKQHFD
ncbi:MerR family transcriptional regulator [Staphylococcus debuckii]|uniref:MerR family transcriptional regulator n=1 Tax=Staphylococcus debuckii TaxID=2044912 RepID=UPI000F42DF0C|nr:MerR family transcriptional regulator [Staphylococcus debuckii]AYU54714.1 MerR family transcriptional regulator [Staphylococcus debuckii]